MKLTEAAQSKRPIRRLDRLFTLQYDKSVDKFCLGNVPHQFTGEDLTADWEVEEEKVTLTRSQAGNIISAYLREYLPVPLEYVDLHTKAILVNLGLAREDD